MSNIVITCVVGLHFVFIEKNYLKEVAELARLGILEACAAT